MKTIPQQVTPKPIHQSLYTLFCTFDLEKPYFGQHQKWTFRGDELTPDPKKQIEALTLHYYQLKQREFINKATIFCNASPLDLPVELISQNTRIIKNWFRGNLQVDNSAYVRYNPNTDFEFSEGFKDLLIKWNLYQDQNEFEKFNNFNSGSFFY